MLYIIFTIISINIGLLVLESNWIHEVHHRPQLYFVRSPTDKQTYDV